MKETFYFQHDYNAKDDPKILELRSEFGASGYGIYWMLLESMASEENGYLNRGAIGGLSVAYAIPKDELQKIIEFCISIGLFDANNDVFYSKRMIEHKEYRKAASENGLKGAKKRWENRDTNSPPIAPPNAKERKGKEKKEDTSADEPPKYCTMDKDQFKEWYNNNEHQDQHKCRALMERYKHITGISYYYDKKEIGQLSQLLKKFKSKDKKQSFRTMLNFMIEDEYFKDKITFAQMNSLFNNISEALNK